MDKTCQTCGGSGQIGYFQGESRFVITWEECLDCFGTGLIHTEEEQEVERPKHPPTSLNEPENSSSEQEP